MPDAPSAAWRGPRTPLPSTWRGRSLMHIRTATLHDATAISQLIKSLAHRFTLHPEGHGAGVFLKKIEPDAIARCVTAHNFCYQLGFQEDALAGVVAVRDNCHLQHFFVAESWQRQGVGSQLWQCARQTAVLAGNTAGFTVNASPYAVPVYQRLGFQPTGPRVERDGIAFIPMRLSTVQD